MATKQQKSNALATIDHAVLAVAKTASGNIKSLSIPGLASRLYAPLAQVMPTMKLAGYTFIPVQLFSDSVTVFIDNHTQKIEGNNVTTPIQKFIKVSFDEYEMSKADKVEHDRFTDGSTIDRKFVMGLYRKVKDKAITYPLKRLLADKATDDQTVLESLEESLLRHYVIPDANSQDILKALTSLYLSTVSQDALLSNLTAKELIDYLIIPSLPDRKSQAKLSAEKSDDQ
jgi:hypothetical protein